MQRIKQVHVHPLFSAKLILQKQQLQEIQTKKLDNKKQQNK